MKIRSAIPELLLAGLAAILQLFTPSATKTENNIRKPRWGGYGENPAQQWGLWPLRKSDSHVNFAIHNYSRLNKNELSVRSSVPAFSFCVRSDAPRFVADTERRKCSQDE
jgi:hypothetical protein